VKQFCYIIVLYLDTYIYINLKFTCTINVKIFYFFLSLCIYCYLLDYYYYLYTYNLVHILVSFIYIHMCFSYKLKFYMPHIKCYAFWKESHQTCDEYHVWKRWHNVDVKRHEKDEYLECIVTKEERKGIQIVNYLLYFRPRRDENFRTYHRRTQNTDKVFE